MQPWVGSTAFGCPPAGSTADASIQAIRGGYTLCYTQGMVTLILTNLVSPSTITGANPWPDHLTDRLHSLKVGCALRQGHGYTDEREGVEKIEGQI
jgi:hypothetical protein